MQDGNAARAKQVLRQAGSTLDPARMLVELDVYSRVLVRVFAADYGDALTRLTLQAAGLDIAGAPTSGPTPGTHVCNSSRRFCAI